MQGKWMGSGLRLPESLVTEEEERAEYPGQNLHRRVIAVPTVRVRGPCCEMLYSREKEMDCICSFGNPLLCVGK